MNVDEQIDYTDDVAARWIEQRDKMESLDAIEKEVLVVHFAGS